MPKKIISTLNISHEEWLDYRRQGIGGSDAAVVVGLNPYKSSLTLYADKKGLLPETLDNEAMRVGRDLEEYVAKRFSEATGKKVRKTNFIYAHDEYDFIRANVDREIVGENAGLECKTASALSKVKYADSEIPLHYYCQCQHYMAVMGYDKMYLAVLVMGKGFYWFEIERSESEINALLSAEKDWWYKHIINNEEPLADGSESSEETLKLIHPESVEVTETYLACEDDIEDYNALQDQIKQLKSKADELKNQIAQRMATHSYGYTQKWKVSYKTSIRQTVDSTKLKAEYPDVYRAVAKSTSTRTFRITELKG